MREREDPLEGVSHGSGQRRADRLALQAVPFTRPGERSRHKSWPGELWKIGGATAWSWISYDPELDLIYYGTSNAAPWNPDQRPGDNKWSSSLFARRPDTGEAVWAYQLNPHDEHDYDGVNENILLDLNLKGRLRKVLAHPDRNGRLYIIDRATGEVISAEPFAFLNTSLGVDLKTGKLNINQAKTTGYKTTRDMCPAPPGGKDWQPSAFSPRTSWLYIPHNNLCFEMQGTQANYISGTPYLGANVRMYAGPGGNRGEFSAFDPITNKTVWAVKEDVPSLEWCGCHRRRRGLLRNDGWLVQSAGCAERKIAVAV